VAKNSLKLVSVVIPTKNEEKNIAGIIKGIKKWCSGFLKEVIVVDGHSQDKTKEIAVKLGAKVVLDSGKGKGDAIKEAIKHVKGKITVFIDADGSHDPVDIKRLIKPILANKADHVSGSRMLGGSDELHGDINKFLRMTGSDIITLGINYRFGVRLTDTQNGFRAIRTSLARKLDLKENITTIEQEMIIKTLRNGYKIIEIPTHEYSRKSGESTIRLRKVAWRYVYSWLKYLFF
jgi:dolichol-phosphate mannosyltransferase